jgi:hypothetical protein
MAVKVKAPGLATTVQDLGRPGYYHLGIPLSGAMDQLALIAANLLVGNDAGRGRARSRLHGPGTRVHRGRDGGRLRRRTAAQARRRGRSRPGRASSREGRPDPVLRLSEEGGAGLYRGVGRHRCARRLGSRSTYTLGGLGGHEGRRSKAGDTLKLGQGRPAAAGAAACRRACASRSRECRAELRMLPGLYWHRITEASGKQFFEDTWKVANEADRIGYRFKGGKPLEFVPREQPFGAGFRSLQHRRCLLSLRLDPGAGRHRAHRAAPRRGLGRRLHDGGHGDFRRHGPDRPAAHAGALAAEHWRPPSAR